MTNFVSNSVSVINISTNTVVATVPVGTGPNNPAVTPDGARLYVANGSSDDVSVVDTATDVVVATVPVGDDPRHLAITPDGTRAYVSNTGSANLSVLNTDPASATFHTVIATVATATFSRGVAITPNGARAYVAVGTGLFPNPDQVMVVDTNPASPTLHTVIATITVESNPWGVAITPDGARVYVVNNGSNTASVISTATNTVTATLANVGGDPQGIAITSDGEKAYVASTFNSARVIDINPSSPNFHTVTATVSLGDGPAGIAMTPPNETDLTVTKSGSPDPVIFGADLTYVLTVENRGPSSATGVVLTDTLPAGAAFVSAEPGPPTCNESAGTVTCTLGALTANTGATVTLVVAAPSSQGAVTNTAGVTGNEADPVSENSMAVITVEVIPPPTPIPGLTRWGWIVLAATLGFLMMRRLRRRRVRG